MLLLVVVSALVAAPARGHHSLTDYDPTSRVTLTASVREFHFVNPHPFLVVDGRLGSDAQVWRLELDNRRELVAIGMTSSTFGRGDQIVVSGAPGRDRRPILYVRELDRAEDGLRYEQVGSTPRMSVRARGADR